MSFRPIILVAVFAAGVASALWAPGVPTLRKTLGVAAEEPRQEVETQQEPGRRAIIRMDDERIGIAKIEQAKVGPRNIARRLLVAGTIAPDSDRVAHVSVKLSGTVAQLRRNIGEDVQKGDIVGALESREVADAKSEYLAARLSNDLQQDLAERDRSAWGKLAIPEQQYIKSRNAAAQTAMRLDIARQKLLALGIDEDEIASIPQAPESLTQKEVNNLRAWRGVGSRA